VIAERLARDYPRTNRDRGVHVYSLTGVMVDVGLGAVLSLWQVAAVIRAADRVGQHRQSSAGARRGARPRDRRPPRARVEPRPDRARVAGREPRSWSRRGAVFALGVAWAGLRLIHGYLPARIVRFVAGWDRVGLDGRVVVFTAIVAVAAAIVFGLLPALQFSRDRVADALKSGWSNRRRPGTRAAFDGDLSSPRSRWRCRCSWPR